MGKSDQKSEQKTASGTGTVTAVNASAKKITLDHAPIVAIDWPAMKMEFAAAPSGRSFESEGRRQGPMGVDQTNRESQIDANDTNRTSFRSRIHCAEV